MLRFDSPELIDQVYDACLTPELWDTVLCELTKGHHASFGAMGMWNRRKAIHIISPRVSGLTPLLAATLNALVSTDANPFLGATFGLNCGEIGRAEDIIPAKMWRQGKMGEEVMRPAGVEYGLGINLTPPNTGMGGLTLFRDGTAGPFTNEDIHSAEFLAPHLVRAARLMTRLSEVRTREHLACEALEQFAVPVFVVNSSGRVRFVNAAGRAIIAARDGLCIVNGRLEALRIDETAELAELIHGAALARRQGYSTSGGSLSVTRQGNRPAFDLVVAPLSPSRSGTDWPIEDAALVVASRQKPASARAAVALQKQFNLTPAETRLALRLGEGIDPKELAERLSVSINTIRTQLQRLYGKTGTKRQAELVQLVLTHPATIISGGDEESVGSNNKR